MVIKGKIGRALLGASLLAAAPLVSAQNGAEIHTFGGLEMGYGTFSFEQKLDQTVVFPVANLTGGVAYKRFNAALNLSGSVQGAEVSEEDFIGTAERRDYDLTFGYQANDYLSAFIGYKSGKTDLDRLSRDESPIASSEYYKQSGAFAGINLGRSFENAGKLDFSIAYALLDGDNFFASDGDGVEAGETREFDDIDGRSSGSSTGYSINLGWTIPISGNLLFRSKLKHNSYQQDIRFDGQDFNEIREQSNMLIVGVIGVF
ncbi:hypothetical protein [Microbulbifer hydrolyticus]|uniref:Outer membrane beta-barrel protein n=1 Tax=Microbulbifer hydrolyticus TaxID=48074 RepID=A0A6P1TCI2_9GAMM|nr:hypothetical protein [Microbulbifer hydrolyticus]MBB5210119.1 hypothetical protein [Microbulbifer hydrolyticus]QHQ39363.1 hypothetical protein GTQ55_10430 [Microbulbifer hydrolyticus]